MKDAYSRERSGFMMMVIIINNKYDKYFVMKKLLTETKTLMNHVFWFEQDFSKCPERTHYGTAINYTDIRERKADFLRELINTITSWVYSNQKCREIIDERIAATRDYGNAATFLTTQAFSKFRPGHPQGQFGELLLFNFIQHFYKAVPLLRKQPITTSIRTNPTTEFQLAFLIAT